VYLTARWGQDIYADFIATGYNSDGLGNGLSTLKYWTPENPTNDFPRPRWNTKLNAGNGYTGYTSLNMVDGSFFKVKTITLAYTLPVSISRKVYSERIRFYATGNNIFTYAKSPLLKNYDPERGGPAAGPITRQVVFGANVDF